MSNICVTDEREAPQIACRDLSHFRIEERLLVPYESDRTVHTEGKRVAIIGAGPAGLFAANILAQLGSRVTVFEALPIIGGMLSVSIPADRRPQALVTQLADIVRQPGIDLRLQTTIGRDLSFQHLQEHFDAILLAVGTQKSAQLNIPGETMLEGVIPALHFLRQYHCCPHLQVKGDVAVIGGGMATIDVARLAKQVGAHSVQVFLPGTLADLPARAEECEAAQAEGILFHPEEMPRSILGTEDVNVHGLRCQKTCWESRQETTERSLTYVLGTNRWYVVDIVLVALGEQPDLSFAPEIEEWLASQPADNWSDEEACWPILPGVFAAGDVVSMAPAHRTLLHALTGGYEAAHIIHHYLCTRPVVASMPGNQQVCLRVEKDDS